MITNEQVAELREGDVVEYAGHPDLHGAKITGPLRGDNGALFVADYVVRHGTGSPPNYPREGLTLTVVSRAPRPLYVNHDRTEPVAGDVVRDADGDASTEVWVLADDDSTPWLSNVWEPESGWRRREELPDRLRLLVDGKTGQVVP